jgi:hypothetical protein
MMKLLKLLLYRTKFYYEVLLCVSLRVLDVIECMSMCVRTFFSITCDLYEMLVLCFWSDVCVHVRTDSSTWLKEAATVWKSGIDLAGRTYHTRLKKGTDSHFNEECICFIFAGPGCACSKELMEAYMVHASE